MLLNREIRFGFRVFFLRYKLQSLVHWDSWAPPGEFRRELALLQILLSSCTEWRICYPFTSLFWHFYALSEPLLWLYSISTSTYWTIRNPFIRDILCALSSWSRWVLAVPRVFFCLSILICDCQLHFNVEFSLANMLLVLWACQVYALMSFLALVLPKSSIYFNSIREVWVFLIFSYY